MAEITASLVKELRERTGSGMMECKKALQETGGDIEAAVESMRKAGQAKADKKAGRIAAEGLIAIKQAPGAAAMVEINCETDFVTKNDDFRAFADAVTEVVLSEEPGDLGALLASNMVNGQSVEQSRRGCIGHSWLRAPVGSGRLVSSGWFSPRSRLLHGDSRWRDDVFSTAGILCHISTHR